MLSNDIKKREILYNGKDITVYYTKKPLADIQAGMCVLYEGVICEVQSVLRGRNAYGSVVTVECRLDCYDEVCQSGPLKVIIPRQMMVLVDNIHDANAMSSHIIICDAVEAGHTVQVYVEDYGHKRVIYDYLIL